MKYHAAPNAFDQVSADNDLRLTIEILLAAADEAADNGNLTADGLAGLDDLLEPVIRRGQTRGVVSSAVPASQLAFALRSLVAGLYDIGIRSQQDRFALARQVQILFKEAAQNAG